MSTLSMCAALAAMLSPLAIAQDAAAILKKVAANYHALTSYDLEQVVRVDSRGSQTGGPQRVAGVPGGKYRNETLPNGPLYLSDGQYHWSYNPGRNEFTKQPARAGLGMSPPADYTLIGWRVKAARILREETLELESGPAACYVIETETDNPPNEDQEAMPSTYWVDKTRFLVWKQRRGTIFKNPSGAKSEMVTTISVTKASFNEPVPESVFQFNPPDGAVEVEKLTFGARSPAEGKMLPDFKIKDLAGNVISPATLRGNLAVIHFWPYCSGPDDLPAFLELLHQKYRGQGVVVVTIVTHPGKNCAAEFGEMGYSQPLAPDWDGRVSHQLGVPYSGILMAGRDGKVIYSNSANRAGGDIIKEIRKAGLW